MRLQSAIKQMVTPGVYRLAHPLQTYTKALTALRKLDSTVHVRYVIDELDSGLSAMYPRAIILHGSSRDNDAVAWGKGVTPIASACSGLMEFLEAQSKTSQLEQIFHRDDLRDILDMVPQMQELELPEQLQGLRSALVPPTPFRIKSTRAIDKDPRAIAVFRIDKDVLSPIPLYFSFSFFKGLLGGQYLPDTPCIDTFWRGMPINYGDGAGNTYEEAIYHSIIEVVELMLEQTILKYKIPVHRLDLSSIDNPLIQQLLVTFLEAQIPIDLSDWSWRLGIPAIAVTYWDPNIGKLYYKLGTGSSPEEAAQRALTEFIQTFGPQRARDNYDADMYLISQLRHNESIRFSNTDIRWQDLITLYDNDIAVEIQRMLDRIRAATGLGAYVKDWTHPTLEFPITQVFFIDGDYHHNQIIDSDQIVSGSGVDACHLEL